MRVGDLDSATYSAVNMLIRARLEKLSEFTLGTFRGYGFKKLSQVASDSIVLIRENDEVLGFAIYRFNSAESRMDVVCSIADHCSREQVETLFNSMEKHTDATCWRLHQHSCFDMLCYDSVEVTGVAVCV